MPAAQNAPGRSGSDGKIYAIGGLTSGSTAHPVDTVEVYDTVSNTWAAAAPMPTARTEMAVVAGSDGKIYAIGGAVYLPGGGSAGVNAVEAYDPATGAWTTVAPVPVTYSNCAAATGPDGKIYVVGDGLNTVAAYDPPTDTWSTVAPIPTARYRTVSATGGDGRIYVMGGNNNGVYYDSVEAYQVGSPDTSPPNTLASLSGPVGTNGWYIGTVTVTLTASDPDASDTLTTFYAVDGGAQHIYTTPFEVSGDAIHTLSYWSIDHAGNEESPRLSRDIMIDGVAPGITFDAPTPAANAAGWNNSPVDLTFTPYDNLSGVAGATPGSPLHFSAEGANQAQTVTVTDIAGNSATITSPPVNIDITPPVTDSNVNGTVGAGGAYTTVPTVTLLASDATSGVDSTYYRRNGGATQLYTGPFKLSRDGSYTITFWSVDRASNAETPRTITVLVAVPPVTRATITPAPNGQGWNNAPVTVTLTASDNDGAGAVASTHYILDGGAAQAYTTPFPVSNEGHHTLEFWSVDTNGNVETPDKSTTINIDSTTPVTTDSEVSAPAANGWYSSVQVTLTSADNLSGVKSTFYSLDGGTTWKRYSQPLNLPQADNRLVYYSVDVAGNTESPSPVKDFPVDRQAPTISASINPTSLAANTGFQPVTVSGNIADAVSGLDPNSLTYSVADKYGQVQPSGTITINGGGDFSFSLNLNTAVRANDTNGRLYRITIHATDLAGNSRQVVVRIIAS